MPTQRIEHMLKVPHTDLVVIAATRKHTPSRVEVHGTDGAIVFLKPVQQSPDSVVP
jgi:hypothetical protein